MTNHEIGVKTSKVNLRPFTPSVALRKNTEHSIPWILTLPAWDLPVPVAGASNSAVWKLEQRFFQYHFST